MAESEIHENSILENLKIDPEFRDKIPPLTEAEYVQLLDNILEDGEVYEPICVWNGTIVDGHNRWKIIQENPGIPYKVKQMNFENKWAAFEWMYRKQLGRRNLTEEQKAYMRGKMYEARKKSIGGNRGNQHTNLPSYQSGNLAKHLRTGEALAKELGVGYGTVMRSYKFSQGVDAIRQESAEIADKILNGESGVSMTQVSKFPELTKDEQKGLVSSIMSGNAKKNIGRTREIRNLNDEIAKYDAVARDVDITHSYTVEDLYEEISVNAKSYIETLKRTLEIRRDVIEVDKGKIRKELQEIINEIKNVRAAI